jgi:predicted lipase
MIGHAKVSYEELTTLLALSIWIHEVGGHVTKDEKCLHFKYGIPDNNEFMRGYTLDAIQHVVRTQSPTGRVIRYVNDIQNGLQVAVAVNRSTQQILVVFRGTDHLYDWFVSCKACKCKISTSIAVHSGCLKALELHKAGLYRTLDSLLTENPTFSIIMTGHGFGGALATLFGFLTAERLSSTDTRVKVVSFGSPRVGNLAFRHAVDRTENLTVVRVTNQRDILTAVPFYHYHHVGQTAIHLQKSGFRVYENYGYSLFTFSLFSCWSAADHSKEAYWTALLNSTGEVKESASAAEQLIPSGVQMY